MKIKIIFLLSFFIIIHVSAQEHDSLYTSPVHEQRIIKSSSFSTYNDSITSQNVSDLNLFIPDNSILDKNKYNVVNFRMQPIPHYYNYNQNIYTNFRLDSESWLSTARINENYIGLGGMSSAEIQYNHYLNDRITMSSGLTFSKYNVYNNFYNDINVNSNLRFELSDRFYFNMFGSYSPVLNGKNDLLKSLNSPLYPNTNFGGAFEFKVTDKWGIMTGAKREYDVFRRKWVTEPFIMPVFYSK
ncbi:MAG: hypothetical protein PHH37_12030 [Paludibacter sp.]|nr:hypothetical protein [Paludibacter sp.]